MKLSLYVMIIWRRKWIILLTAVVALVIVVVGLRFTTPAYTATATLRIFTPAQGSIDWIDVNPLYADRLMNTYMRIATSEPLLAQVARELGVAELPAIEVESVANSELVEVTAIADDPALAASAANTLANLLQTEQVAAATGLIDNLSKALNSEISRVEAEMSRLRDDLAGASATSSPDPAAVASIELQLQTMEETYSQLILQRSQLNVRDALATSPITVIDPAAAPAQPSSPEPVRDILLAMILGLAGGLGLAFIIEHFDQRLYTTSDMERAVTATTLGRIPQASRKLAPVFINGQSPVSEAFRQLRTNILHLHDRENVRTLLITSVEQGEGKTTVTVNLALSMAYIGKRVIVIDGDLRKPTLHELFKLKNDTGLTSVLVESECVENALQQSTIPGVMVLTSGPIPHHPADLLGFYALKPVLDHLTAYADIILIDSPAFMPVSDASLFAKAVDGMLLVMRRTRARQDQIQAANDLLGTTRVRLLGTVFNQVEASQVLDYSGRN